MSLELHVSSDPYAAALAIFLDISPLSLVLAGGATPRPLYERMAATAHDWASTDVFFSDERCVPHDHPDSNFRLAFEALLSKVRARAHPMPVAPCDPDLYESELRAVFASGRTDFDLAILGLGEDGHTASLFPGDPALDEKERLVLRVQGLDYARLTLTLPALSASKVALFLVTGEVKAPALHALLAGEDIPAARVKAPRRLVIADHAAASLLTP